MSQRQDYEELEAVVLDYIQRYGLTETARRYYLHRQERAKDDGELALGKACAVID